MSDDTAGESAGVDANKIEAELGDAISQVLSRHEKSMVLKWSALVETMDQTGERGLWTLTSDNCQAWDTVGMLQHALHLQQLQLFMQLSGD